jgi:molecular chaperone GrpE
LTPDCIEAVLADFRLWLRQLRATGAASPEVAPPVASAAASTDLPVPEPVESLDLHTLLSQFVALRHEVNLQTRAARAQQEQGAEALRQLSAALESLTQSQVVVRSAQEQDAAEQARPLLKVLVDVYDTLALAGREALRMQETILPLLHPITLLAESPEDEHDSLATPRPPGFWARWLGGGETPKRQQAGAAQRERMRQAGAAIQQVAPQLESLVTGYTMSLRRIERALQQAGIDPITCVGQQFDPEQMEVLEVATDSDRPTGEVLQEVRRGYLWRGRVFRCAQVRVAKPG